MRILDRQWRDGFLDEARTPGTCRVGVKLWVNLEALNGLYFVRPREPRMLWNYAREIGVAPTLAKVAARRKERLRNDKYLSVGLGSVLDADPGSRFRAGCRVVFAAPCHPRCAERVVLADELLRPAVDDGPTHGGELVYAPVTTLPLLRAPDSMAGWRPESGLPLDADAVQRFLADAEAQLHEVLLRKRNLRFGVGSPVAEQTESHSHDAGRPSAVLFGYGNYAKTLVLPNVERVLDVGRVHEIDPTQLGPVDFGGPMTWDTSPIPRPDDRKHDVWLIAGYHHSHAPLAVAGMESGAAVVVEKPLATSREQLSRLGAVLENTRRPFYACFQKRYSLFNDLAKRDLAVVPGQPISYFCIVFEVPLPARHWYHWPVSRSRVISNGCHWLDHFLYLNDFCDVSRHEVVAGRQRTDDTVVVVELHNGATFSMTLTSRGSDRLGLRNHVELRAGRRTVTIDDDSRYVAEDRRRVIRRHRSNRLDPYGHMYRTIAEDIVAGKAGDSAQSVLASASLALAVDERYQAARNVPPT